MTNCFKNKFGNNSYLSGFELIEMITISLEKLTKIFINEFPILFYLLGSGEYPQWPGEYDKTSIPIWIVIGAIVAILLVGFILVDLACFKINRQGNIFLES